MKVTIGTVRMSDGTTREARRHEDGTVQFATFGNANSARGHGWRKATAKQAETFSATAPTIGAEQDAHVPVAGAPGTSLGEMRESFRTERETVWCENAAHGTPGVAHFDAPDCVHPHFTDARTCARLNAEAILIALDEALIEDNDRAKAAVLRTMTPRDRGRVANPNLARFLAHREDERRAALAAGEAVITPSGGVLVTQQFRTRV